MVIKEKSLRYRFLARESYHGRLDLPETRLGLWLHLIGKVLFPLWVAVLILGVIALIVVAVLYELGVWIGRGYRALVPFRPFSALHKFLTEPVQYEAWETCCADHRREQARRRIEQFAKERAQGRIRQLA